MLSFVVMEYWKRTVFGVDELETRAVKPLLLPEMEVTEPSGEETVLLRLASKRLKPLLNTKVDGETKLLLLGVIR